MGKQDVSWDKDCDMRHQSCIRWMRERAENNKTGRVHQQVHVLVETGTRKVQAPVTIEGSRQPRQVELR
jgi:hypothetical protein